MKKLIFLFAILFFSGCTSNRKILTEIRDKVEKLSTQEQVLALRKSFTVLDSTIRATNVNVLDYEISKTRTTYDSLNTADAVFNRAKEVLNRIKKGSSQHPP